LAPSINFALKIALDEKRLGVTQRDPLTQNFGFREWGVGNRQLQAFPNSGCVSPDYFKASCRPSPTVVAIALRPGEDFCVCQAVRHINKESDIEQKGVGCRV